MRDHRPMLTQVLRSLGSGVIGVALLSLACNLGALAVPVFNMEIFNRVMPTRSFNTLSAMLLGLSIGLIFYAVVDFLRLVALTLLGDRLAARLSLPLLEAVAGSRQGAGATAEALNDLETVRRFVASPAVVAPFDMMWAPLFLLVLLIEQWAYALLGLICCLILAGLNVLGDTLTRRDLLAASQASAEGARSVSSVVEASEAVVAMGMLPALHRRWEVYQGRATRLVHQTLLRSRLIASLTRGLRLLMTACMVSLGLILAVHGLASSGSMVAGNMILAKMLQPFESVATTRRQWIDALAAWKRIRALLQDPPTLRSTSALPTPSPRLSIDRLVFLPPSSDRPILRGISFQVHAGEVIAIIGPSGAGKTTLLRMIVGMDAPTAGGVFLDGTSTFIWEREDLSRHVGYVPQSAALLDDSIVDNIARLLPSDQIDLDRVIMVAKQAGIHRAIMALPNGYATRLTPQVLSAGQRQRVALARALYPDPCLLVLDEPNAFLDRLGTDDLKSLLLRLKKQGKTVILSTHRPDLLDPVDRILVLREGLIDRIGSRDTVAKALQQPAIRHVQALVPSEAS